MNHFCSRFFIYNFILFVFKLEEALKETNAKYVYVVADSNDVLDKFKEKFPKVN